MVSDGEIQALGVEVADLSGFRLRESVLGEDLLCEGGRCGSGVALVVSGGREGGLNGLAGNGWQWG